jgi:hypothetical protein
MEPCRNFDCESTISFAGESRRYRTLPMSPDRTLDPEVRPDGFEPPTTWFEAYCTVEIGILAIVTS